MYDNICLNQNSVQIQIKSHNNSSSKNINQGMTIKRRHILTKNLKEDWQFSFLRRVTSIVNSRKQRTLTKSQNSCSGKGTFYFEYTKARPLTKSQTLVFTILFLRLLFEAFVHKGSNFSRENQIHWEAKQIWTV